MKKEEIEEKKPKLKPSQKDKFNVDELYVVDIVNLTYDESNEAVKEVFVRKSIIEPWEEDILICVNNSNMIHYATNRVDLCYKQGRRVVAKYPVPLRKFFNIDENIKIISKEELRKYFYSALYSGKSIEDKFLKKILDANKEINEVIYNDDERKKVKDKLIALANDYVNELTNNSSNAKLNEIQLLEKYNNYLNEVMSDIRKLQEDFTLQMNMFRIHKIFDEGMI